MKQMLVLLLLAPLIAWLLFSPIYRSVYISKKADLQKEVDYLLETGARLGYISTQMMDGSKDRLYRFNHDEIEYVVESSSGQNPSNPFIPLLRGDDLSLTITYPTKNLFQIDRLIGMKVDDGATKIVGTGTKMVEYVAP